MRLGLAHEPGRSVNSGAPRGLLWFGVAIGRLVGSGLDLVEVDVPVLIALLLVELDPNPAALQLLRTLAKIASRKVVYSLPASSRSTKRRLPPRVFNVRTSSTVTTASMAVCQIPESCSRHPLMLVSRLVRES